ncbi:hypothetical protein PRZ48_011031 [Zasmidium cellare]|uniref:AB hydrolase-1 domain-containing protein n=1 Tax=Zasmidium cellare TaxID=395010 RepID=A0ABR0EB66_ZASCE|nr:hypothetical protein PRZ48_011031 [Zasmidium cellare]
MLSHIFGLLTWLLLTASRTVAISVPGSVPGTTSHFAQVGGNTYHYLRSRPEGTPIGTILLLHGYPDFSYGWRYQIPHLTSLGYLVITPDMLGYADTDAPAEFAEYAKKKLSTDMALLMDQIVPNEQIIVGGHDWGADLTYKLTIWYPDLVKAFFTLSVPYWPPVFGLSAAPFVDLPYLVLNNSFKTLGYELQWRDFDYDRRWQNETEIHWLLNAAYGGLTANGTNPLSPYTGFDLPLLPHLLPNTLLNASDLAFYVQNYAKKGLRGPDNWYRTYHIDWEDELQIAEDLAGKRVFHMPSLFIPGTQDAILTPSTWNNSGQYYDNLTIMPVNAGHWVMPQAPDEVNRILTTWLAGLSN